MANGILCFLQNRYEANGDNWDYLKKYSDDEQLLRRVRLMTITYYIHGGRSMTARRLQKAFPNLRDEMWYENSSSHVGTTSSSKFQADVEHMKQVIEDENPRFIVAFGTVARDGLLQFWPAEKMIHLPHPASRTLGNEWQRWESQLIAVLPEVPND